MLTQLGVKSVAITREQSSLGTPGTVIGQSPVSGATIAPGTTVTLRVVGEPAPPPSQPAQEPTQQPAPPPVPQP